MSQYAIFGLQRSGTNFLENLVSMNYGNNMVNNPRRCWKHSISDPVLYDKTLPTIIIHKNPYTWIESISMRNNVDWLKSQKMYPADESTNSEFRLGKLNMNLTNLAKTYEHFHNNWLDRKDIPQYVVIRYEDLLVESLRERVLERIETSFDWNRKSTVFNIPKRGDVSQSKCYDIIRESYYIDGIPKTLTKNQIEEVNRIVGTNQIRNMGYNVL